MSRYVYAGPTGNLGRFGLVTIGDVLDLTEQEALSVANDPNYFAEPTRSRLELKVTANRTLTSDDVGKKIVCNHQAAIKITLPASPTKGDRFEIYFGDSASDDDVTIEPGETNAIVGPTADKKVASTAVTNAGTNFSSIPTVDYSAGDGTGATGTARMKALTAAMAAAGTGYNVADTITLAGGTKTTAAIATVATIKAVAVAIAGGGTGYAQNDVLTVSGGTSTVTAQITVNSVDGSGVITAASVTRAGSYTVKPGNPVSVTGGTGTGATFNLTWGVLTATITTAGDYSALPSNAVAQASTSGSGTGATFNLTWGVLSVTQTAGGEGYTGTTFAVTFTGGGGSGAAATATLGAIPGNLILDADADSVGIYWNGANWVQY